ncbi:MAG: nitroreductase family protein [Acidimicrobiia bacterium]|nr:MAG: nitroreductase family protein [Acidimicrobiia bacterium]
MDLYEALYTTRAMRRVASDPVPGDVVQSMLDAAIRSPSGGNTQSWRWLTVTDRPTIADLGLLYADAWAELNETFYKGRREAAEASGDETTMRVLSSAQWLADNFDQVPLVVLPFHRNDPSGASIYPAVWSLMLAARGHGVGTTLTTVLGTFKHVELAGLLGVPTDKGWQNAAVITCGYPLGRWGLAKRAPVHEVVYEERWGETPSWRLDEPLWER